MAFSVFSGFLRCGDRSEVGLSSPLFIPLKNDVSAQPSVLAAAAQPRGPILCLAVENLRLALVLDLEGTDFRV